MHSKFALFKGPLSGSVFESKETKEPNTILNEKCRHSEKIMPIEHCCILVKHFEHQESVNKPVVHVPLVGFTSH